MKSLQNQFACSIPVHKAIAFLGIEDDINKRGIGIKKFFADRFVQFSGKFDFDHVWKGLNEPKFVDDLNMILRS